MQVVFIVLLALALFYVLCLAAAFLTALLIARHEIRKHHERWRFG